MYKIHSHDQETLNMRYSVKSTVLATIRVALQDPATFFRCQWLGQAGQTERSLDRHELPPSTIRYVLIMPLFRFKKKPQEGHSRPAPGTTISGIREKRLTVGHTLAPLAR